ncbi:MAG: hypothetical protein O9282_02835 [Flavobacterium sp.]|uniref:hypothetical protein n=1 Tax=Flavobacterium sp. TaxID=239 RepID=UPI0022BB813B|nr:hypothetical protein [Flavobacterium sp.]MCZ8330228.1 hypothetical protein [Flavobacterium sp.]
MNKTNKSLVSNRFLKLEREIFEILSKSKETLHLKEIKSNFPKRASMHTTRLIVDESPWFDLLEDETVELSSYVYADITYTITGGSVTAVYIDGKRGSLNGGTVYGARLVGNSFMFELRIEQDRIANWSFNTSSISLITGGKRSLQAPVTNSVKLFIGNVPTI